MDVVEVCRACLSTENVKKSIFYMDLPKIFHSLTNLVISKTDGLPSKICMNCADELKHFDEFKSKCITSNDILKVQANRLELNDPNHVVKLETYLDPLECTIHDNDTAYGEYVDGVLECVIKDETTDNADKIDNNSGNDVDVCDNDIEMDYLDVDEDNHDDVDKKKATRQSKIVTGKNDDQTTNVKTDTQTDKTELKDKMILKNVIRIYPTKRKVLKNKIRVREPTCPFVCKECGTGFVHKEKYDGHLREHEGKKPAVCQYCGGEYSWYYLSKHMEREHKEHILYKCHCGKTFAYESIFIEHKTAVHGSNHSFICETCGKSFYSKGLLDKHSLVHKTETPFECNECGKQFKAAFRLRNHQFRHKNIRNHKCDLCGKAFISSAELRVHLRSHSDVLAFACILCGQRFRHKVQVTTHMKMHM